MPDVSPVATLVGTALGFVLGGLWYGPLFGRRWQTVAGPTPEGVRLRVQPAVAYGATFGLSLVACYALGWYLGPHPGLAFSLATAAVVGVCWVSASLATNDLFEGRGLSRFLIHAEYHTVRFLCFGLSFGLLG
jgi:hypothetical protein